MKTKAAILQEYQKPLTVEEVELDKPKAGEVLVKMRAAGLCHSDLSIMNGIIRMPPLPCIPGHEGAGVIQEVGPGVTRVKPGDPDNSYLYQKITGAAGITGVKMPKGGSLTSAQIRSGGAAMWTVTAPDPGMPAVSLR